VVVPVDPPADGLPQIFEAPESLLPDTLFLQASEEALHQAVLFRGVGRDELLRDAVVLAGGSEAPALEDQALSLRSTGFGPSGLSVPKRRRHASSRARSASFARPRSASS